MAGQVHLVLVGTSVLRNALRRLQGGECEGFLAVCGGDPRRVDRERCRALLKGELGEKCLSSVAELAVGDPYGMSAELNAMDWVLEGRCSGVQEVVLYASDTPEGGAAAEVLRRALGRLCPGLRVVVRVVHGLGSGEFWPGLLSLVRRIHRDAWDAVGRDTVVYLNATGGFKPESSAALIAAMLAGQVAAYYKHEAMRETVMLPAIPLQVDRGRVRALTAKLRLAAVEWKGRVIALDDPDFRGVRWLLEFLARSGLAETRDGGIVVDDRVAELLEVVASVYDELASALA